MIGRALAIGDYPAEAKPVKPVGKSFIKP